MKLSFINSLLIFELFSLFNNSNPLVNTDIHCDSVPELNKQIIVFVNSKIKKKVGKGECWDLAAEALNSTGAKWNGKYVFGTEINYQTDCIFPGDIMQFEKVKVEYIKDGKRYTEMMAHHTSIIQEVKGEGDFVLAHQNTGNFGKKVGLSPLNVKNITKGKFKIYRPTQ